MRVPSAVLGATILALSIGSMATAQDVVPPPVAPKERAPGAVSIAQLEAHLRFLASDLLEGRGIGTRGGRLAASYIEAVFQAAGLKPAFGASFRQPFAMTGFTPDPTTHVAVRGTTGEATFEFGEETVGINFGVTAGRISARPLFVGYAIDAPSWQWDDFKEADVRGRLLVAFTNEPGRDDPDLFRARELTVHGRWRTKFEAAARRGAAGMLLVHTDEDAGYPWQVTRNSWSGEALRLTDDPAVLPLQFWLREPAARHLAALAGTDLDALRREASRRDFRPRELPVDLVITAARTTRATEGTNVVGVVEPRGAASAHAVVLSAHFDHLGIGYAVDGDAIYNGAVDNGSALAVLLSLAQGSGQAPDSAPGTLVFAAVDAEEEGLLGSAYYCRHPAVPLERTLANINFEMTNVWGRTRDVIAIGAEHSELQMLLRQVLATRAMRLAPDPEPDQGFFFRSDQYSFAQAGVPALWLDGGLDIERREAGYGARVRAAYRKQTYHQPSDEMRSDWDLSGTQQVAAIAVDLIRAVCSAGRVNWRAGSEFSRPAHAAQ